MTAIRRDRGLIRSGPWVACGLVLLSLLAAVVPGAEATLEYDRARVAVGEPWRILSAQIAHYGWRMRAFDLGVLLLLGSSVEVFSRRLACLAVMFGAASVGLGIHLLVPAVTRFRGSSGIATALFVAAVLEMARPGAGIWLRVAAFGGLGAFLAKAAWEIGTGQSLFAGPLPEGASVVPAGHLLGAAAGVLAWILGGGGLPGRPGRSGGAPGV